jgi:hypothetical protein
VTTAAGFVLTRLELALYIALDCSVSELIASYGPVLHDSFGLSIAQPIRPGLRHSESIHHLVSPGKMILIHGLCLFVASGSTVIRVPTLPSSVWSSLSTTLHPAACIIPARCRDGN